jgi:hypothetical protein
MKEVRLSDTIQLETGCGKLYVHLIYSDEERTILEEVKTNFGKAGGCGISHLASKVALINALLLKANKDIIIRALVEASGHSCHMGDACHDKLIRLIKKTLMKEEP